MKLGTVTGCSLYPYRMGHRPKPTESPAEGAEKGLQATDDNEDGEQADDKQKGEKSPK